MTRGAITGTVRDEQGAGVPGATVTAKSVDTGSTRSGVTDHAGSYRLPALEPGRYVVRVDLPGFSSVEVSDVHVQAASEPVVPVTLKVAARGENIVVEAKAEGVELNKTNATVGLTTTTKQVAELPLGGAGRNINNLVFLSPNVTSNTGQGGFSVNGQRSRNNNFMIDGSDNNDISVTIATSQIVPEAVAEYQVMTNPFSVEYGRSSGAQINVITKSGSNSFHGEAWEFYQNHEKFASLSNIDKDNELTKPSKFTRNQFGGDIGGPIIKDKTFFFLLYQHDLQRPGSRPGATIRIPTAAGYAALQNVPLRPGQPAASRQAVLQRLQFLQDIYSQNLVFLNSANTLVNGVSIETAQVNVPIIDPSTYKTFLARLDHRLSDRDSLTLRYSYNGRLDDGIASTQFGSLFAANQDIKDTNVALSETHTFTASLLNEFRFSMVRRDLAFPENDPVSPTAAISGLFTLGGAANFPQGRVSETFQFFDTATWMRGRHTLKFGADVRYNKLDNEAAFNSKGSFGFNSLQDFMNNNANGTNNQAVNVSSFLAKQWQTFLFVQDDFRVSPDLTLNLGLRYELSTNPLGFFGATDPLSLSALVPPPPAKDTNNWAPRVGFAWSPSGKGGLLGDGKTVARGGFGVGYDVLFYNLLTVNASNYPRVSSLSPTPVLDVYPNKIPGSAAAVFTPTNAWTNSAPDTQNPAARYWSFSIQRQVSDFVFEAGYVGSRAYHGINQIDMNPARVVTPAQAALVASTRNAAAIPNVQARRLSPQFGPRVTIPSDHGPDGVDTEARSEYNGVFLSVNKRLSRGLQFNANYTYSRTESNNDASLGEGGTGQSSQRPQDYFDYAAEWSVSQFDRPHRVSLNYIWEVPGPKSGILKHVLGGWQISGVTAKQSGQPFTIVTGVDSNGDGNTGSDRPNINPSGTFVWDEDHRTFKNNGYYTAPLGTNNLPLSNSLGNGNAGRNSERGPGFANTDLSVLKRFWMGQRQLVLRGDLFNAFNQDNYGVPVNTMTSPSFGTNTNNWGRRTASISAKFIW